MNPQNRGVKTAEHGFTLVELLTVVLLMSVLLALTAGAARQYWFVRSLEGGQEEIVTQLRRLQQRTIAESHPRIYGARFPVRGSDRTTWAFVRVNVADDPAASTCVQYETREFDAGVRLFNPGISGHTSFAAAPETTLCRNQIAGASDKDDFVFFYARGTATAGKLTLEHPSVDYRRSICVSGLTGRVETEEEAGC